MLNPNMVLNRGLLLQMSASDLISWQTDGNEAVDQIGDVGSIWKEDELPPPPRGKSGSDIKNAGNLRPQPPLDATPIAV